MAVKRKYRLNLRNYGNLPAIMLSQYDEGYALEFEIRDGTDAASDLSAYTVTLKGTRADALAYSFAGTVSTNVLTFVIDTTMTACAGRGTAEIAIKDTANDVLFATFNMPVFVERAAVPEGSIDADVERAQEIAEQVQEIVDNAAAAVSGEAEKWATGQINGTDVPSTDPTYENNAKYYAEQAADAAASIGIDATLTQTGKAADAKKTGDEISTLKEDLTQLNETGSFASWACGMVAANGSTNIESNAISPLVDCSQNITIDCKSGSKFYLYFYNASGEYIGKVASDGTINTTSGSWKSFTGEVDPSEWKPSGAAYYRIALIPTDGTVLTNDNVGTWANLHCDLKYTSIDRIDQALGTSSEKTEKNLVNQLDLLSIPQSSYNAGWYSVSPSDAYIKYNESKSPFPVREAFKVNTQYTLSFDAKYTGSVGTTLSMQFLYTDFTKSEVTVTGSAEKHYVMTSIAGKTVDSLRLSYNNSVTTDVRNLMLVEGIEEPAEFFPYDDVTAVDLVARAISKETAAKVGEMEPAVKTAVSADTGVRTSEFNVSAGTSHSSLNNQITLAVAKDEFFYCVATGIQGRNTGIWIRNDNTEVSVGGIADGIVTRFRAPINIEKIGLFLGSGTENASVTFAAFAEKSVLSKLTEKANYDNQYLAKLLNAKRKANPGNYNNQTSPEIFALAHFSDIHGNVWAMKKVQEFKDTYKDYLDDVICTGDVVSDKISDGTDFWSSNSDGEILICIGNHDSLGSDGWANPVAQQTLYETYIAPYEENWSAETVSGHSYWYKDYSDKKIRLIAVDATIYDATEQASQMTWLNAALNGAATNGYAVVGAIHFPPMPADFKKIDSNFTALLHGTAGDMSQFAWNTYHTEILTAVNQFIDNGGDFVCWLSGHTHYDLVSYDNRFPKQLFITISCAMPSSLFEERSRDDTRGNGLVLNTVCVDTVRKYVKLIRYGAEWDDCLRHTGTCVIKYDANPPQVMFSN